jgi:hypothetical protein
VEGVMASYAYTAPIIPHLLKYSVAPTWKDAKSEWRLNYVPICEICVIENEVTKTVLEVGDCCINQVSPVFEELKRIFPALKKGRINPAIINYARERRIINEWETGFLKSIWCKRSFTEKQVAKLGTIKEKIFKSVILPARRRC